MEIYRLPLIQYFETEYHKATACPRACGCFGFGGQALEPCYMQQAVYLLEPQYELYSYLTSDMSDEIEVEG